MQSMDHPQSLIQSAFLNKAPPQVSHSNLSISLAQIESYIVTQIECGMSLLFHLGRTTPFDDRHIGRKLELLEAEDQEKLAVRNHFIALGTKLIILSKRIIQFLFLFI